MTNQEAFDKIVKHLVDQKWVTASNDSGACVYLAADGCKCAVGCLIPPDQYKSSFEQNDVSIIYSEVPALADISMDLLTYLQDFHDVWMTPDDVDNNVVRLERIARDFGLDTSILTTFAK